MGAACTTGAAVDVLGGGVPGGAVDDPNALAGGALLDGAVDDPDAFAGGVLLDGAVDDPDAFVGGGFPCRAVYNPDALDALDGGGVANAKGSVEEPGASVDDG